MELENFLIRTISSLNEADLKYVIVGGFAAIYRGKPRTTLDLEVIIENNNKKLNKFLENLRKNNFDVLDEQISFAIKEKNNITIFDNISILRIDLKIARTVEEINTLNSGINETYKGIYIIIAPIEQILWGKILYMGDIEEISDSELLDSQNVIDFINVFLEAKDINMNWLESKASSKGFNNRLSRLLDLIKKMGK